MYVLSKSVLYGFDDDDETFSVRCENIEHGACIAYGAN